MWWKITIAFILLICFAKVIDLWERQIRLEAIRTATQCTVRDDLSDKTTEKCIQKVLELGSIPFVEEDD